MDGCWCKSVRVGWWHIYGNRLSIARPSYLSACYEQWAPPRTHHTLNHQQNQRNFSKLLAFLAELMKIYGIQKASPRRNFHHHSEWIPVIVLARTFLIWRILIHSLSFVCPVHPQGWEQLITMLWDCHNTEQQCLPGVSISLASGWGYYYSLIQHLPPHLRIYVNRSSVRISSFNTVKNTNFQLIVR